MRQNIVCEVENMIRIAIDGPGGAGKSSVAKAVAKKLNMTRTFTLNTKL